MRLIDSEVLLEGLPVPQAPNTANNGIGVDESLPTGVIPWEHVKLYMECPQRFWYRTKAGLRERGDYGYPNFRTALYGTLASIAERAAQKQEELSLDELQRDLDARFDAQRVATEGQAAILRQSGHTVARRFSARIKELGRDRHLIIRPWVLLSIGSQTIGLRPSEIEVEGDRNMVARMHFFRPRSESHDDRLDVALLYAALGSEIRVELWYPLDGTAPRRCALEERRPELLPIRSRKENLDTVVGKKLAAVQQAMIKLQSGQFDPTPDDHICDGCGFQYACPGIL
ncbi:MAG: hypothetical protein QM758_13715 [Armatimonas sp.]